MSTRLTVQIIISVSTFMITGQHIYGLTRFFTAQLSGPS